MRPDSGYDKDQSAGDFARPDGQLQNNIEVSVMNLVGGVAVVVIAGFAAYRLAAGQTGEGLVNAFIAVMIAGTLLLGRMEAMERHARVLFGLAITAACLLSSLLVSSNGLLWTYLVLSINFLILPQAAAISLNLGVIVVLSTQVRLFDSILHHVSWVTVALLLSIFGLIFTRQLRRQRRMLEKLATEDPLTGTGNRRVMQHDLEAAVDQHHRNGSPSTLMVIDIDHFKQVNDAYGHDAGDMALAQFTRNMKAALRAEDGLYRMGGEEFVVLLRGMDADTARAMLPGLHRRLSGHISGSGGPIFFSAGTAVLHSGDDWSSWLARADTALLHAKQTGRNQIVISDSSGNHSVATAAESRSS